MTAPVYGPAVAILRRAGLLFAVPALMAGIFGMHVLTTTHALHSTVSSASVEAHHGSSSAAQPAHHTTDTVPRDGMQSAHCADPGHCTSAQAMNAACTPSAKAGSLAAPLPGNAIIARRTNARDLTVTSTRWSYLPVSPSPGELCISRT